MKRKIEKINSLSAFHVIAFSTNGNSIEVSKEILFLVNSKSNVCRDVDLDGQHMWMQNPPPLCFLPSKDTHSSSRQLLLPLNYPSSLSLTHKNSFPILHVL